MNGFLRFAKRLLIFILLVVAVDRIGGFVLKKLYFSQEKGQFSQITYSLDSTTHDVLVFGSSRAIRHYSPAILSEKLKKSVYNVGMDGQMIPYYAALQEVILNRYTPKMIILDVTPWELNAGEAKYHKLSALLPYVDEHPELLKYVSYSSDLEPVKLYSHIYPYNSSLFIGLYNFLLKNKLPDYANGYLPLERSMGEKGFKIQKANAVHEAAAEEKQKDIYDEKAIALLRQFLRKAEEKNIKTLVVVSPVIFSNSFNSTKLQKLRDIVADYPAVKFYDYSQDTNYTDKFQLYADIFHLNKKGAERYSSELAHDIVN
ncbi:hypothetical protein ACFQRK_05390 [Parapedobacter sp. GCM10030251]|uniref:hypothetical protein n=1 Tax=Parapedobacter sp. GCM10030251 TaxID=3273419 RepID=UPI00360C1209